MEKLVRWLFAQQCAQGGAIQNIWGSPHIREPWQEVPSGWFMWETVISVPWQHRSEINVGEARARNLAVRARARQPELQQQRFLHFLDSQVNLGQAKKGRTGSRAMAHVLSHTNATLLCTGMRDVNAFTRSERNPADKASRDRRRWSRYRRHKDCPPLGAVPSEPMIRRQERGHGHHHDGQRGPASPGCSPRGQRQCPKSGPRCGQSRGAGAQSGNKRKTRAAA